MLRRRLLLLMVPWLVGLVICWFGPQDGLSPLDSGPEATDTGTPNLQSTLAPVSMTRVAAGDRRLKTGIYGEPLPNGGYRLTGIAEGTPADLAGLLWMLVKGPCADWTSPDHQSVPGSVLSRGYPPLLAVVAQDDTTRPYAFVAFLEGGSPIVSCTEWSVALSQASPEVTPEHRDVAPGSCPVTTPPDPPFMPPTGFSYTGSPAPAGQFWYGNAELWTQLDDAGVWSGLPVNAAGELVQRMFWWRGQRGQLQVSGYRLGAGGTLESSVPDGYGDLGWQVVGLEFPAPGCWRIHGQLESNLLSLVVWVAP